MATKKKAQVLDITTLEVLLKEASKEYKESHKIFEKTDCSEAMHDSEHWRATISWLSGKIEEQEKAVK